MSGAKSDRARNLTCACCGQSTRGRQWWNRDTGYGVCPRCADDNTKRYGEGLAADTKENPCSQTTHALYGVRGYHFAVAEGDSADCRDYWGCIGCPKLGKCEAAAEVFGQDV